MPLCPDALLQKFLVLSGTLHGSYLLWYLDIWDGSDRSHSILRMNGLPLALPIEQLRSVLISSLGLKYSRSGILQNAVLVPRVASS